MFRASCLGIGGAGVARKYQPPAGRLTDACDVEGTADRDAIQVRHGRPGNVEDRYRVPQMTAGKDIVGRCVVSFDECNSYRMQARRHWSSHLHRLSNVIDPDAILFFSIDVEQSRPDAVDAELKFFVLRNAAKEFLRGAPQQCDLKHVFTIDREVMANEHSPACTERQTVNVLVL